MKKIAYILVFSFICVFPHAVQAKCKMVYQGYKSYLKCDETKNTPLDPKTYKKTYDDAQKGVKKVQKNALAERKRFVDKSKRNIDRELSNARQMLRNTPFDAKTWQDTERLIRQRMKNTPFDPNSWAQTERLIREEIKRGVAAAKEKARLKAIREETARINRNYQRTVGQIDDELHRTKQSILRSRDDAVARVNREAENFQLSMDRAIQHSQKQIDNLQSGMHTMEQNFHRAKEAAQREVPVDPLASLRDKAKHIKDAGRSFDNTILQPTLDSVKAGGRAFDENVLQPLVVDPLTGMLSTELIVYNYSTTGAFTFNVATGSYWMRVDLPMGGVVDSTDFHNWLQGRLSLPSFDPIEIATQGAIVNHNRFDSFYSQNKNRRSYVASKRFVDWFSLETVANETLQAYLTAGASVQGSLEAAKKYLLLEWDDLYTWLESQGVEQVESVALEVLEAIVNRRSPTFGNPRISASLVRVPYTYTLDISTDPRLLQVLDAVGLAGTLPGKGHVLGNSPHIGFVVNLDLLQPQGGEKSLQKRIDEILAGDVKSVYDVLLRGLSRSPYPGLDQLLANFSGGADPIGGLIRENFVRNFNLKEYALGNGSGRGYLVDLRDSPVGNQFRTMLDQMAFGNQSSVRLEKLEIDLNSMQISCDIRLYHKHSWGSVQDIKEGIQEYAKSKGLEVTPQSIAQVILQR